MVHERKETRDYNQQKWKQKFFFFFLLKHKKVFFIFYFWGILNFKRNDPFATQDLGK